MDPETAMHEVEDEVVKILLVEDNPGDARLKHGSQHQAIPRNHRPRRIHSRPMTKRG